MEILTTPWKSRLLELVSKSKKTIKITSPFVTKSVCDEVLAAKKSSTKLELITSFDLRSIRSKFLDISAIEKILDNNGTVKSYKRLHSKIYLFDDEKVIITSGNLTNGGLMYNYEYGVYSKDTSLVSKVSSDFNFISKNENTGRIKKSHITTVKEIISNLPKVKLEVLPDFDLEAQGQQLGTIEISNETISNSLRGWKLEIFNCVNSIQNQNFSLSDINKFESQLRKIYPSNQHITDKIRQQLQYLRDIGLIEFLGNGQYKKLWNGNS